MVGGLEGSLVIPPFVVLYLPEGPIEFTIDYCYSYFFLPTLPWYSHPPHS